ncbi:MAG: C25 family cysteine peptidase [Caldilinea sp.]|nr:C25 family cysteine peptidase [Caldilinea sp.]
MVVTLAVVLQPAPPAGASVEQARLVAVTSDAGGVTLSLQAPPPTLHTIVEDGQILTAIELTGAVTDERDGALQTPVVGALVAVPPEAAVAVEVLALDTQPLLVAAPFLVQSPGVQPSSAAGSQPASYAAAQLHVISQPAAELVDITWWRSQRVARVRLRPVRVEQGSVLFHPRMVVRVRFNAVVGTAVSTSAAQVPATAANEGAFEPLLRSTLLNYDQGLAWRVPAANTPVIARTAAATAGDAPWWRVTLAAPGLARLECAALAAAGVPMTGGALHRVQLYDQGRGGRALAVHTIDNADDTCDATDAVVFYAPPAPSTYAAHLVVWLTLAAEPGAVHRATLQPVIDAAAPATEGLTSTRYERNRLYYSYVPLVEGAEHWYWDLLAPATGPARTYPFTLTAAAILTAPLQIALDVAGYDGAHVTLVAVNGATVITETWSGRQRRSITATVAPELLRAGSNDLRVTAAGSSDLQYVDAFTVTVRQRLTAENDRLDFIPTAAGAQTHTVSDFTTAGVAVYDISEPPAMRVMATSVSAPCPCTATFADDAQTPRRYVALSAAQMNRPLSITAAPSTALRDPTAPADYLILAPAGLLAATAPLADHRGAQGLAVRAIDLQAIYDEFGDGRPHPEAIRAFIAHALAAWPRPAPAYVLLVGDGTYDPLGYLGAPPADSAPAYLRLVDPRLGETASDNRLASAWDSPLPHVMIGRLPAATPADVAAMVAKILTFESAPVDAAWRGQATLVADNAYAANGAPDAGGNFWQKADAAAALLAGRGVAAERLYYNPCDAGVEPACALPYATFDAAPPLSAALAEAWQAGRRFVIYTGHGSPTAWAGAPTLLTADAAAALETASPPVVLEMSCYTGFFHFPLRPALAEVLLRTAGGGAVATWSSSGQSVARGHDLLLAGYLDAALSEPAPTLGAAILAAKLNLFATGGGVYDDLLDTFHLFGDPALQLAPPPPPLPPPPATTATPSPAPGTETPATPTLLPGATPGAGSGETRPSATPTASPVAPLPPAGASLFLPLVEHDAGAQ